MEGTERTHFFQTRHGEMVSAESLLGLGMAAVGGHDITAVFRSAQEPAPCSVVPLAMPHFCLFPIPDTLLTCRFICDFWFLTTFTFVLSMDHLLLCTAPSTVFFYIDLYVYHEVCIYP